MPYADLEKAFDVAVKHLFRNLTNASALRRNPLVQGHFGNVPTQKADEEALHDVRKRILREAAICLRRGNAAGNKGQATRQHAIVLALCSSEDPSNTVARLGLSQRQYYRDRRTICTTIAKRLSSSKVFQPARIEVSEPFALLLRRSQALFDQGLCGDAIRMLDAAWGGISPGNARFAARLETVKSLLDLGELEQAEELLHCCDSDSEFPKDEIDFARLQDRKTLLLTRLFELQGRGADASRHLIALANHQIFHGYKDDIAVEILLDAINRFCYEGNYELARSTLFQVRSVAKDEACWNLSTQISLELLGYISDEDTLWKFQNSAQRLESLLTLCSTRASVRGFLGSNSLLMQQSAFLGSEDAMYRQAQDALTIARSTQGYQLRVATVNNICFTFLNTSCWRLAAELPFEIEPLAPLGSSYWVGIKFLQGRIFLKLGRYREAYEVFSFIQSIAKGVKCRRFELSALQLQALALGQLGRTEDAADMMNDALKLAGLGMTLYQAYFFEHFASGILQEKTLIDEAQTIVQEKLLSFVKTRTRRDLLGNPLPTRKRPVSLALINDAKAPLTLEPTSSEV